MISYNEQGCYDSNVISIMNHDSNGNILKSRSLEGLLVGSWMFPKLATAFNFGVVRNQAKQNSFKTGSIYLNHDNHDLFMLNHDNLSGRNSKLIFEV